MSGTCARFRSWMDDDRRPDEVEERARAEHLRACGDCREEMKGIVVQRALVPGAFGSGAAGAPLPEDMVARCVGAMARAARADAAEDVGQSAG